MSTLLVFLKRKPEVHQSTITFKSWKGKPFHEFPWGFKSRYTFSFFKHIPQFCCALWACLVFNYFTVSQLWEQAIKPAGREDEEGTVDIFTWPWTPAARPEDPMKVVGRQLDPQASGSQTAPHRLHQHHLLERQIPRSLPRPTGSKQVLSSLVPLHSCSVWAHASQRRRGWGSG